MQMNQSCYTVITFAPVQGFIEKSRKLRDLYGSSYLLSYLAWVICKAAEKHNCKVVSPALPNITQGMPNQIIIEGNFPEKEAESALNQAWECVVETCREWIEENVTRVEIIEKDKPPRTVTFDYSSWKRSWNLWKNYAWEFFWVQGNSGESITRVREKLNEKKRGRNWTGINWQGESSTLSGADAIAYPKLGQSSDPRKYNYQQEKQDVTDFYTALSEKLGESFIKSVKLKIAETELKQKSQEYGKSFIDPDEQLSIPELIKRLITHDVIADELIDRLKIVFGKNGLIPKEISEQIKKISDELNPTKFTDLSRHEERFWTGWFQGDGDKASDYLKSFANKPEEGEESKKFSQNMREWGSYFQELPKNHEFKNWRVIYAGGDDFLGAFYRRKDAHDCVKFFSQFKSHTWNKPEKKKISVSVGFVWAGASIPQRDVLQHCREAEKSAKNNGRDRIAFRVLFNNGNYLEWVCPWWLLEAGLLSSYQDRSGNKPKPNWTHIYTDVAVLESRHAFDDDGLDVALGLLEIYFPDHKSILKPENLWNEYDKDKLVIKTGILGDSKLYHAENSQKIDQIKVNKALTNWIINLAKVGFHLCQQ